MSRPNSIHRAFDAFGKARFEAKRSGTWLRSHDGVEQAVNLQKSQYSLLYYLNVRFDFTKAVAPEVAWDESDLGVPIFIEGRAERLLTDQDGSRLRELLDIDDHPLEEEHREHELLALLNARLGPALDELASFQGIRSLHGAGGFRAFGVSRSASRILLAAPDA